MHIKIKAISCVIITLPRFRKPLRSAIFLAVSFSPSVICTAQLLVRCSPFSSAEALYSCSNAAKIRRSDSLAIIQTVCTDLLSAGTVHSRCPFYSLGPSAWPARRIPPRWKICIPTLRVCYVASGLHSQLSHNCLSSYTMSVYIGSIQAWESHYSYVYLTVT